MTLKINGCNSINLQIIKRKQNWNVGNSYGFVATATKIRFHFWFPRSPNVAFGGHIGWLLNWKYEFGWKIIISSANYVNYNYFCDDGIAKVTLRLWEFSDFSSRHTVGITDDVIMYHILVDICFQTSNISFPICHLEHIITQYLSCISADHFWRKQHPLEGQDVLLNLELSLQVSRHIFPCIGQAVKWGLHKY